METDVKQKITDTVKKLLFKKSIDKITVKEIVITAGISRQAFYYHFSDMYEVMELICEQELPIIVKVCSQIEDTRKSLELFVKRVAMYYPAINKQLNSKRRAEAEYLFLSAVRRYLQLVSERINYKTFMLPEEKKFLIEFVSCGIMAYFSEKCLNGETVDAEFFSNEIYKLILLRINGE